MSDRQGHAYTQGDLSDPMNVRTTNIFTDANGHRFADGRPLFVRWMMADTGECKERNMFGVDRGWTVQRDDDGEPIAGDYYAEPFEMTALDLALGLVPDLQDAIDRARSRGESVEIRVRKA